MTETMSPFYFAQLRTIDGLSQRAAAKLLGIGFRTLQRIESGEYGDPIPEKYRRLILSLQD